MFSSKDKKVYLKIIGSVLKLDSVNNDSVLKVLQKNPLGNGRLARKSEVLEALRVFKSTKVLALSRADEKKLLSAAQMKKTRTISGVTPVTVLTKPYPCPGQCIFCPNDTKMPKSYISSEPGAQRAETNKFDPYFQTYNRLVAYKNIGHPVDKVELIVLGGTWSAYPENYQVWFIRRCFDAMNDVSEDTSQIKEPKGTRGRKLAEEKEWKLLEEAHLVNETAYARCVGLVLETRPDEVTEQEAIRMRKLGATKVQIGIQSLNDSVLKKNKRGHTVKKTAEALGVLRKIGFKIHAHWMPNLYGSTPAKDIKDYQKLFSDPRFKPDELKIYPCSLLETAELMSYHEKDLWKPYTEKQLLHVLMEVFKLTPKYCRLTRVIRDIPSQEIVAGNKKTNFRQLVEAELARQGIRSKDIRAREVRGDVVRPEELSLHIVEYDTSVSRELFLEYVTKEDKVAGFLRLSFPTGDSVPRDGSVENGAGNARAMVREVHVYGQSLNIGKTEEGKAQHAGLGKSLIQKAVELSRESGFTRLNVISSVGTREYYRKNGFSDGDLYQHLDLHLNL
jgi:elongator complex protein 3